MPPFPSAGQRERRLFRSVTFWKSSSIFDLLASSLFLGNPIQLFIMEAEESLKDGNVKGPSTVPKTSRYVFLSFKWFLLWLYVVICFKRGWPCYRHRAFPFFVGWVRWGSFGTTQSAHFLTKIVILWNHCWVKLYFTLALELGYQFTVTYGCPQVQDKYIYVNTQK